MKYEVSDSSKNMINLKSIIVTVLITSALTVPLILLHYFDQSHIPYNIILAVTIFTMYLVKFVQNPSILKFFVHKMSQRKLILKETALVLRSAILKVKVNRVGVQNPA